MKRITRVINAGPRTGERVWLDQHGSWRFEEVLAFEFEDREAEMRVRRIPHAETEDVANNEE